MIQKKEEFVKETVDVTRIVSVGHLLTASRKIKFRKHKAAEKFIEKYAEDIDQEKLDTAVSDVTGSELVKLSTVSDTRKIVGNRRYTNNLWREFTINKRGFDEAGKRKKRKVFVVDQRLALAHEAIKPVLDELPTSKYSYAYVKNRGAIDAAWNVAKAKPDFIWRGDLMDFFPSTSDHMIAKALIKIGWRKSVAYTVAHLSTRYGKMEQGSKVAPVLSNIVAKDLYDELGALSEKNGLGFMAYSDDLYFYGNLDKEAEQALWDKMKYEINGIVQKHSYRLRYEKWIRRRSGLKVLSVFIKNGYATPDGKLEGLCRAMILEKLKPGGRPHFEGENVSDRGIASRLSWVWQINKKLFMTKFGNYVTKLRKWYPNSIDEKIRDLFPVEFREEYFIKKEENTHTSVEDLLEVVDL